MAAALRLGRRNLGRTYPNPAVGAVVVARDETGEPVVVGRGWTAEGGRPHAETVALAEAGAAARGATLYVTLEPCSHQGKTPPCADALVEAGIARVVMRHARSRPAGERSRHARLEAAGIAVTTDLLADEAARRPCRACRPGHHEPAAHRPQARRLRRRDDRPARGRAHDHQRPRRVRGGAGDARRIRRGDDRHRHGAGRQSASHRPSRRAWPRDRRSASSSTPVRACRSMSNLVHVGARGAAGRRGRPGGAGRAQRRAPRSGRAPHRSERSRRRHRSQPAPRDAGGGFHARPGRGRGEVASSLVAGDLADEVVIFRAAVVVGPTACGRSATMPFRRSSEARATAKSRPQSSATTRCAAICEGTT